MNSCSGGYLARKLAFVFLPLLLPLSIAAQDLEPRTYTNLPTGQNFLGLGYIYSDGEVNPSPSVPLRDIEITMKVGVAAYVRSLDLWGKAGKFDAMWGRACQKGSGYVNEVLVRGDRCGTLDPSIRLSYLFYGAPAMDLKTFRSTQQRRVIGASLQVNMPLGDYNNENIINTGSNRWTFKPEIGVSKQHSLKFYAHRGLVSNIGNDSDTYGIVWQYRWSDQRGG